MAVMTASLVGGVRRLLEGGEEVQSYCAKCTRPNYCAKCTRLNQSTVCALIFNIVMTLMSEVAQAKNKDTKLPVNIKSIIILYCNTDTDTQLSGVQGKQEL